MSLKKQKFFMAILACLGSLAASAQTVQKIGNNSMTISSSAVLEIESTTKGFLPPRMTTTNRDAITAPATGLWIFNTTSAALEYYNGNRWISVVDAENSATVTGYVCSTGSAGSMNIGSAVAGVTQTITAAVTKIGTYNISTTTVNGVTFAGSGKYTATGNQDITLTASGTPIVTGTFTYAINGTPTCSFSRVVNPGPSGGFAVCDGTKPTVVVAIVSTTGKTWMDRNLGASQAATSYTDFNAYGCLYQWGRGNDGHASITWQSGTSGTAVNGTTNTLATTDNPGNALWIMHSGQPADWRIDNNSTRWQGVSGTNNPCPTDYRLPTLTELDAEFSGTNSYNITDAATAYNSVHKFVMAGHRVDAQPSQTGILGYLWTSTVFVNGNSKGSSQGYWYINGQATNADWNYAAVPVRCIKN